jgi:glucose 1-dehydrogenase
MLEQVRCLVVQDGRPHLADRPPPGDGDVLVEPLAVGLDGTDEAVARGEAGSPPPGSDALVLGHEALLRVAANGGGFDQGDLAVPLVRRGCGRCEPCARKTSDLCETGLHTEHGIQGLDGWCADLARAPAAELVLVPRGLGLAAVLAEPLSIGIKALQHAEAVRDARRGDAFPEGAKALVIGLGSLGSTACLALRDAGFEVDVLDRSPQEPERAYARATGCTLLRGPPEPHDGNPGYDLVVETPGKLTAIAHALKAMARNGVLVTLGTPTGAQREEVQAPRMVRELVEENQSILGSVNSNRTHFVEALRVLQRWHERETKALDMLLQHRFPPEQAVEALDADVPLKKLVVWERRGHEERA